MDTARRKDRRTFLARDDVHFLRGVLVYETVSSAGSSKRTGQSGDPQCTCSRSVDIAGRVRQLNWIELERCDLPTVQKMRMTR